MAGAFLGLELLLAALGVDPDRAAFDPYAGFTSRSPHYRVEVDAEGGETVVVAPSKREVLNDQRFAAKKPEGTYRIVCLGGSTTYGRPFFDPTSYPGRLRALLPEVDGSKNWEVINAGAISYASYRVRGLLEELARYEPDLFIIDVGHNEFLERRTYADVFRKPSLLRETAALAGRTRVGTAVQGGLRRAGLLGSNTFARSTGLVEEVRRAPVLAVGPEAFEPDEAFRRDVVAHFESALGAMIDAAERAGARVALVVQASNLRDFAPFKSRLRSGASTERIAAWDTKYERGLTHQAGGDHAAALAAFEEAKAIDDGSAALCFARGRSLLALDRGDEARASFLEAKDRDVCPFRSIRELQEVVRKTARARGTLLVDVEEAFARASAAGSPGDNLFCDHVHLQPAGARAVALELLSALQAGGVVSGTDADPDAVERAEAKVRSAVDGPRHARELYGLAGLFAALGRPGQALDRVRQGLALSGGDAEGFRLAGRYSEESGDLGAAIDWYRRALALEPRSVEALEGLGGALLDGGDARGAVGPLAEAARLRPGSAAILNRLGITHALLGRGDDSIAILQEASRLAPAEPAIRRNLGMAEERRGNRERAAQHYREALRLKPGDPESLAELARLGAGP